MEQQEWEEELSECADCGAAIAAEMGPSYPFGESSVLCLECAIRRGGRYDSSEERWVVPPKIDDLERESPQR